MQHDHIPDLLLKSGQAATGGGAVTAAGSGSYLSAHANELAGLAAIFGIIGVVVGMCGVIIGIIIQIYWHKKNYNLAKKALYDRKES